MKDAQIHLGTYDYSLFGNYITGLRKDVMINVTSVLMYFSLHESS